MKKILLAVCAIAVVTLTGCKKDENDTPSGEQQQGEGIYNPGARIATLATGDETQTWVWAGAKLDRIESADHDGNATGVQQFSYTGDRIVSSTQTVEGVTTEMRVNYSAGSIASIGVYTGGIQSLTATVLHNAAGKINRIDIDVDASYVNTLLGMLTGFGMGGSKQGDKLSLQSADISTTFEWQGDNVSRMIVSADIDAGVTMEDIAQVVNLDDLLGDYASLASLITGEQPLTVTLRDTVDFTYDDRHNPLQGFIGMLDPQVLSANNYTLTDNHGVADITLTISVPILGNYPVSRSVPIVRVTDFIYTYNAAGFPLTVSDDEGNQTTYTYQE